MILPTPHNNKNGVKYHSAQLACRLLRLVVLIYLSALILFPPAIAAGQRHVEIVLSATTKNYQEVADITRKNLAQQAELYSVSVRAHNELRPPSDGKKPDIIVTVGLVATREQLKASDHTPQIATLVPRISFEAVRKEPYAKGKRTTAVYLDQPIHRQLALAKRLLPSANIAGAILSPKAGFLKSEITRRPAIPIRYIEPELSDALVPTLKKEIRDADLAVLIYDPNIINTKTVKQTLYYSYQKKLPLIGYSKALVDAGALAAVFATNQHIGEQTAKAVDSFFSDKKLPAPTYAEQYDIHCNSKVARYLDLRSGCAPADRRESLDTE